MLLTSSLVDFIVCHERARANASGHQLGDTIAWSPSSGRHRPVHWEDPQLNQTHAAGGGEMPEPVTMSGSTQPMTVARPQPETNFLPPPDRQPSYHPTRWPQVNRLLDLADTLTGGHAKWVQRTFNYLLFGGFAALVNLALITVIYKGVRLSVD